MDEILRKQYQSELEALEHFRMSYSAVNPEAGLDRDDPDVRRLIEAMAFFSARTKSAATRTARRASERLFQQHFSYLLDPIPAAGMLKATPSISHTDVEVIPRETQVVVSREITGEFGRKEVKALMCRTLRSLNVSPIKMSRAQLVPRRGQGPELQIDIEALVELREMPSALSFYIDYLGELSSSMEIFQRLREHCQGAKLKVDEEAECNLPVSFGAPPLAVTDLSFRANPMQGFRSFMQLPEQELFLEATLPSFQHVWKKMTLSLDLDISWPRGLRISESTFHLGVVPLENVVREAADPLRVDGTKDRYALRHAEPQLNYRVLNVLGVYADSNDGLIPLKPGVLGSSENCYELESHGEGLSRRSFLVPEIKDAFEEPRLVSVDACWHQPEFVQWPVGKDEVELGERHLEGVEWSLATEVHPSISVDIGAKPSSLLRLVALKTQEFLDASDLRFLLESLGAQKSRGFAQVPQSIEQLEFERKPSGTTITGYIYLARLKLTQVSDVDLLAVKVLLPRLLQLFRDWGHYEVSEVILEIPDRGLTIIENGGVEL